MALIFPELAPHERAHRYRALAYEARREIEAATGADRDRGSVSSANGIISHPKPTWMRLRNSKIRPLQT